MKNFKYIYNYLGLNPYTYLIQNNIVGLGLKNKPEWFSRNTWALNVFKNKEWVNVTFPEWLIERLKR